MSNAQYTEAELSEFIDEFGELALGNAQPVYTDPNGITHNVDVILNFSEYMDSFGSTSSRNNQIDCAGKPLSFPSIAQNARLNIRGVNYYITDFYEHKLTGFIQIYLSTQAG